MRKLLSLLLSAVFLLMPVLAGADTDDGVYYFTLSNPVVTAADGSVEIDLTGLEFTLGLEEQEDAIHMLAGIFANGRTAFGGHVAIDENGIFAVAEGMNSAVGLSMETIAAIIEEAAEELQNSAGIFGSADADDFADLFSDEALAAFEDAFDTFTTSIQISDPVDDSITIDDIPQRAKRVDYVIDNASIASLAKAFGDLLATNEMILEYYKTMLEQSGTNYMDMGVLFYTILYGVGLSVDGSMYLTESNIFSNSSRIHYTSSDVEEIMMLDVKFSSADDGGYISILVYPEDESAQISLYGDLYDSKDVEGGKEYYLNLSVSEMVGEEYVPETEFVVYAYPYYDESGTPFQEINVYCSSDDTLVQVSFNFYKNGANEGGNVYFGVYEGSDASVRTAVTSENFTYDEEILLSYNGTISADGLEHTGVFNAKVNENGSEIGSLRMDAGFGIDTSGRSIAYDFSNVPFVDIMDMDDETAQSLEESFESTIIQALIVAASEIPTLTSLLTD